MNHFNVKNNLNLNISPINQYNRQTPSQFKTTQENKIFKDSDFQRQNRDKMPFKTQRIQIKNINSASTKPINQKINNLDTLLKQSQRLISKEQKNRIVQNNLIQNKFQSGNPKTNTQVTIDKFNFVSNNTSQYQFGGNKYNTNPAFKINQSISQKNIHIKNDQKTINANEEQIRQKLSNNFDKNLVTQKQRAQRSLSTTIITSNTKLGLQNPSTINQNSSQAKFNIQLTENQKKQTKLDQKVEKKNLLDKIENLQRQNIEKDKIISKLKNDLTNKNKMCEDMNKLLKLKYSQINKYKSDIIILQKQKGEIQLKLQTLDDNMKIDIYQKKIYKLSDELQEAKEKIFNYSNQINKYNQTIKGYQEKILQLSVKNKKEDVLKQIKGAYINSQTIKNADTKGSKGKAQLLSALDEALKVQIKQIDQLKSVIQVSQEQKSKLRQNLLQTRRQLDVMRNQMTILELKGNSQRKNIITEYRLQIHEKQNEINSLNKKLKTIQQKYKSSLTHIKQKDEFLQQHLTGRATEQDTKNYIQIVLKNYSQNFDSLLNVQKANKELLEKLKKYEKYETM